MLKNGYFKFLTFFVDLTDPREDRGRNHRLQDLIALALCGTICGANTWADIERFANAPALIQTRSVTKFIPPLAPQCPRP